MNGLFAGVKIAPQRLNTGNLSNKHNLQTFSLWLLGFTEAKGTFYIEKTLNNRFIWIFYLEHSHYDIKVLRYIKKVLSVGKLKCHNNMVRLVIKEKNHIRKIIIPFFNQLPFITHQHYYYTLWCQAFEISESKDYTLEQKIELIDAIRAKMNFLPINYRSPIWNNSQN